jgi:Ca2+-binding EF-hand superfamily protein
MYYYPEVQNGRGLTYDQIIKFLDYLLTHSTNTMANMEAFKNFDRNGQGQISSA